VPQPQKGSSTKQRDIGIFAGVKLSSLMRKKEEVSRGWPPD
jgi:hypothetical protein